MKSATPLLKSLVVIFLSFKVAQGMEDDVYEENGCIMGYNCRGSVCYPTDYKRNESPRRYQWVYANIIFDTSKSTAYDTLESIDIHNMAFTFSPVLYLLWEDKRLKLCNQSHPNTRLDETQVDLLWKPRITVENQMNSGEHPSMSRKITSARAYQTRDNKVGLKMRQHFSWTIKCKMNFNSFPVDKQVQYHYIVVIQMF